ncbi:MAG TPA: hypothetical protein VNF68_11835 [Candidatus Baltobacteraceae bacterium]|nr:hypothetical protein [Candidatus Baltobacteraceae bacterium]
MNEDDDVVAAALRIATIASVAQQLKLEETDDLEAIWRGGDAAIRALARILERVVDSRTAQMESTAERLEQRLLVFERRQFEAAARETLRSLRTQ